ncbi:MAG: apolipoprotein N-acyltransferase [bacterium (Candidatus Ratteibacteria) CG_4_10_14_3_um_filter_41_18]|uniref:Apolipoprotein N-acyltransferase n=4 Tax=Candidatus Ratteibacteria TaxID=2979319 RepID=A0A2M7E897_9BACT|nr:MAG: apolipoprotein N-acyltransferase [Candidatus Omnitrophica bacterium CG1_02_41_171]PIV63970.1 MAG: apolipoprotein N-acyltransferase [bacterium (Candidatus Ratteibacteria) CG01_land_8_20_14_3_00_40_19]PIW33985.1 MAG: apolipoprotein N-acyltransferase [bacterium (Candidatus Ratteibacteria) CG15_BIG_FIL_POST_REV_8_21_14_020_41_12]PIW73754.1 MAG: apolipoprotein N-acyltransferase [bacterium (Candidatus Ratteibacteria) CG_4_8_14_3_um_filter_41_36]PIX77214.1 MAG: apolipoprotein N-acyltransferase
MKKSIFFSILSGLLLILAFPKFDCEIVAWFALIPLFLAIRDFRYSFFSGYLFGLIFFGGSLFWLANVTRIGFLVLILYLSLYPGLFAFLFTKWNLPAKNFFGAGLWILLEYVESHFLTGFPWLLLGYSQYKNLRFIQISSIFGAYIVSGLVVLINIGLSQLFFKQKKSIATKMPKVSIALSFFILLLAFFFGIGQMKKISGITAKEIKVSLVQGNIPSLQKWETFSKEKNIKIYSALTEKAAKNNPDLVIWPESAISTYLKLDRPIQKRLFELAKAKKFYLLAGSLDQRSGKNYNSAFLISPQGRIKDTYDKIHLVPYGEYVLGGESFPFLKRFVAKAAGFIPDFSPGENYTIFSLPEGNFATLICFEDIFSELSRRFTKKGANFLVNITDDSWFGDFGASQHFAAAVFRAVENRRYLLRTANTGLSAIIAPWGEILKKVEENGKKLFVSGFLVGEIKPVSSLSFYTKFGDAPLILLCIGLIVVLITTKLRKLNKL